MPIQDEMLSKLKLPEHILIVLCTFLLVAADCFAQESSAKPEPNTASSVAAASASGGPGSALGSALAAACSQNQAEFTRFLTARNQEVFSRLPASARVALMKRFVLLAEPGKATISTNPSGRPIVRCETPGATTEMQIGGADIRDNVAFLPLELHDVSDSTGASARQINMGVVREEGQWKVLSLGVLLLDLPELEVEWDESEIDATEKDALQSLKTIAAAIEAYRGKYLHLPESLARLASPQHGAPSISAAGLLDADLAKGARSGYTFRYVIAGGTDVGAPAKYALSATPLHYAQTGKRSFFRDPQGVLHAADHQGAVGSENDPKVE